MATYTSNYAWTKPSGSDPVDISVLNGNLDSQDGIIHDAFLNMAAPFSESSTYAVGDIVLYGTKTYRCRVAVTTAGSWTGATNWDEYKLSELTFDNTPTDGSNNPVKSDGIYDSEKNIYAVMGQMGAKNLIPYPYYETTKSQYNINYTSNDDGVITATGTATGKANMYLTPMSDYEKTLPLKKGRYCVSMPNDKGVTLRVGTTDSLGTATNIGVIDGSTDFIFEVNDELLHYHFIIQTLSGSILGDGVTLKPMLRLATDTDDTYQPYAKTNKQLTDEIATKVDKVTGKGLSTNDYDNTAKGIVDGVTANLALKADKTATASGETLALVPTSEGRALLHTAYGMSTQSGTPTPSSPVDIESAKVNLRSVGKNLIPYPYGFIPANIFSIENDGTVVMNGSTSNRINCWLVDHTGGDYWLPSGTYKIIVSEAPDNVKWAVGVNYYMNNTWVSAVSVATGKKSVNFTVDTSSSAYNIVSLCVTAFANSSFSNLKIKVMVVKDSVNDDTYEPYTKHDTTTDLTLRAIEVTSSDAYNLVRDGKYYIADTLDYSEDNGWSVTRRIKHLGVESTTDTDKLFIDSSGKFFTYRLPTDAVVSAEYVFATGWAKTISNRFTESVISSSTASPVGKGGIIANNNYCRIGIDSTIATDIEGLRTWLTNNSTYIEYVLATPTTETITTAQALALLGLKTYDESTTISSQAEPACTVAVEYAKERLGALALTAYNTAKGNDIRITALEG